MTTAIEWTDETWNPIVGCSRLGPGCDNCYAIGVVHRKMSPQHIGLTVKPDGAPTDWTGEVREVPHLLDQPLRWKRPRRIFVNSLSDLFHADLRDEYIAQVFAIMALAPQHTFQVLTKRPQRMAAWMNDDFLGETAQLRVQDAVTYLTRRWSWKRPVIFDGRMADPERNGAWSLARDPNYERRVPLTWPLPNVWLGTSIETDRYAFRAGHLRATPAAVRFVSAEPLLGPLPSLDLTGIDWLIAGGESGPGARPMDPDWARDLRDRCADRWHKAYDDEAGGDVLELRDRPRCAFLFKQWGAWAPTGQNGQGQLAANEIYLGQPDEHGCVPVMRRSSKKDAGRELDGHTHDEYPTTR